MTMDVLLQDALFRSDPGSCGLTWPRALSSDSLLLPQGTATKTVERLPPKTFLEFMRSDTSSWRVVEVDVAVDDDPALTVLNNQEKLREHSSKRFGTPTVVDAEGKSKNGLSMRGNGPLEQSQEGMVSTLTSATPTAADPRSHERAVEFMSYIAAVRAVRDKGAQGTNKEEWLLPPQSLLVPPNVQFTAEEVLAVYADHRGGKEEELIAPRGAMQAFVEGQQAQLRRLLGIEDTAVSESLKVVGATAMKHAPSSSSSSSSSSGLSRSHLMDEYVRAEGSSSRKISGAVASVASAEPLPSSSSSADSALSRLTALMADIQLDGDDDDDEDVGDGNDAMKAAVSLTALPLPPAIIPSASATIVPPKSSTIGAMVMPPPPPLPPHAPSTARASTAFVTEVDEMKGLTPKHTSTNAISVESTGDGAAFDLDEALGAHNTPSGRSLALKTSQSITSPPAPTTNPNIGTSTGTAVMPTSWAVTTVLPDSEFENLRPRMAVQYPFELDHFQKQAVMRLERGECVFVAAHTSAGKTVVAEYAIAMARRHRTRAIYTSPIKALSNQKYRDFRDKFQGQTGAGADGSTAEVGLITGDVSVNPEANCLIMTTEILRSMLYRGSDTIRDIEWVIFDEVHYVNDAERGVVWEEVIIMLPDRINLIFLSATTPNTVEFSDWIGRTKRRKVYVTSTNKRPVPLQHYLLHDEEIYKLMQAEGGFLPAAVAAATQREKDKNNPKPKSAENAAMAMQRGAEKAAMAAQFAGRGGASSKGGRGGGSGRGDKPGGRVSGSGGGGGGWVNSSGSKSQWISLLKLLAAGGRAASAGSGLGLVDFGFGDNAVYLQRRAALAQLNEAVKYDRLPEEMRRAMTKKEYERSVVTHRSDVEHDDGSERGHGKDDAGLDKGDSLLPVVVFSFSKKKCEEIADMWAGQDLLCAREKNEVRALMLQVAKRLSPQDARLPQVARMQEMLMRGIAVHHGGLLPILKESVELLFSRSVVKALVATETFAMGVNMPARSVLFNGFRKHDGKAFRDLLPGEYTQMAGRAGRRGLDPVGTVLIAAWGEVPSESTLKKLLTGSATKLSSQFRLSYNMILNLIRASDLSVEDMIKRSFSEFHAQKALSSHDLTKALRDCEARLVRLEDKRESLHLTALYSGEDGDGLADDAQGDVRELHAAFERSKSLTSLQLKHLWSSSPSSSSGKVAGDYGNALCRGRSVIVHATGSAVTAVSTSPSSSKDKTDKTDATDVGNKPAKVIGKKPLPAGALPSPCLAVLLSEPFRAPSLATTATTGNATSRTIGMGMGVSGGSSLSAARMSLLGTAPTASATMPSTLTNTDDKSSSPELSDAAAASSGEMVWVLVLLPPGMDPVTVAVTAPKDKPAMAAAIGNVIGKGSELGKPMGKGADLAMTLGKPMGKGADLAMTLGKPMGKMTEGNYSISTSIKPAATTSAADSAGSDASLWEECSGRLCIESYDSSSAAVYWVRLVRVSDLGLLLSNRLSVDPCDATSLPTASSPGCLRPTLRRLHEMRQQMQLNNLLGPGQGQYDSSAMVRPLNYSKEFRSTSVAFADRQQLLSIDADAVVRSRWLHSQHVMSLYPVVHKLARLRQQTEAIRRFVSNENLSLFPDFQQRLNLLQLLGYVDKQRATVTMKGRVACEMNTCDELIASEMLLTNVLEPLNPPEAAAVLSALVFQEKTSDDPPLTSRMEVARDAMKYIFQALSALQEREGVVVDVDSRPALNFGLAAVVYQWARGMSFKEITQMTMVQEGSIVRCITRLDELIRDVRNAARVVGNPSLYRKMEAASQCIKRDIVFAASLYVT